MNTESAIVKLTELPLIDANERAKFDALFVQYGIAKKASDDLPEESEKVSEVFLFETLHNDIIHMEKFAGALNKIFKSTPVEYQQYLGKAPFVHMRIFDAVQKWELASLNEKLSVLQQAKDGVYVQDMIAFVFLLYRALFRLLFISEADFNVILDKVFIEIKEIDKELAETRAHEVYASVIDAKTEWGFICRNMLRGLYPLLMRMCSTRCVGVQDFLDANVQNILNFLQLQRTDVVLPAPFKKVDIVPVKKESVTVASTAREEKKNLILNSVNEGLDLLDRLFPEAGWKQLENMPDMYGYFQPLYNFSEGFNLLSPENPMQVAIILLRVVEDLLPACATIDLSGTPKSSPFQMSEMELSRAINDWYLARLNVFDKTYAQSLIDYVNRLYSQKDFRTSSVGMKKLSSILKLEKAEFFPHLKFSTAILEQEMSAHGSLPVFKKIARLNKYFAWVSSNIDEVLGSRGGINGGTVEGVGNPWERFRFVIENVTSQRFTTLCGGKTSAACTNARLICAIADVLAVLNWWLNDSSSPAYNNELEIPYRYDEVTEEPIFNVPLRNDVEYIFVRENKKR